MHTHTQNPKTKKIRSVFFKSSVGCFLVSSPSASPSSPQARENGPSEGLTGLGQSRAHSKLRLPHLCDGQSRAYGCAGCLVLLQSKQMTCTEVPRKVQQVQDLAPTRLPVSPGHPLYANRRLCSQRRRQGCHLFSATRRPCHSAPS